MMFVIGMEVLTKIMLKAFDEGLFHNLAFIGMEVLTKIMLKAFDDGLFHNMAGISPIQCISIYADDVVLFFRPVGNELEAVKQILHAFGIASGLHINYWKTTANVIRGEALEEERITDE
jgi:hypothetical protein